MSHRKNCIYCNKEITTRSSEHVIQNALGGLLESEDICCPECNNFISKHIDAPFTKIFNPIISGIDNFSKTNNTKSMPPYTGTVLYNGKKYTANIKGGKVVGCPELSRELRSDISKLPLEIISYNFDIQNSAFKTGLEKIAFNYAMAKNVDFQYLKPGLNVSQSGSTVNKIEYNYEVLAFCPMNPIDYHVELNNNSFEPFHNIILFSEYNELWCYIDLFNTFQYYVRLSDTLPDNTNIYSCYTQTLQKPERIAPDLSDLRNPKDIMIVAQQYGVQPCMDVQELSKRINIALARKSQKIPMEQIYQPRIEHAANDMIMTNMLGGAVNPYLLYNAICLYFDNDEFHKENFRTLTPSTGFNKIFSYPHEIARTLSATPELLQQYTMAKFNKMNQYLCQKKH